MVESAAAVLAKIVSLQWVSAIGSSALVASIAAIIRIIFSPRKGTMHSLGTFFGGVLVGTLVGYIINDMPTLREYNSAIVAAVSIGAREVVEWIIRRFDELRYMRLAYLLSDDKFKHMQQRIDEAENVQSEFHSTQFPTGYHPTQISSDFSWDQHNDQPESKK